MARRHRLAGLLLVLAFITGCATARPRPTPAPPVEPGSGTHGTGLDTLEVYVHDLRTPAVGLQGATVVCGGETRQTNPDGTAHIDAPVGQQLDCEVTRDGYDGNRGSAVPGTDRRLTIWLHRTSAALGPLEPLRVEGNRRWFGTAGRGREDYREVSGFSLLCQVIYEGVDSADRWMGAWQELGATAARVAASFTLCPHGQVDPERTAGYWEAVDALNQRAADRGFRLRWTLWMASEPWGGVWYPDRRDIWQGSVRAGGEAFGRRFVERTRHWPHILYELANEPGEIGMKHSFDALVAFGRVVKALAPAVLLNAGSPQHEGDQSFVRPPFDFSDAHLPREYIDRGSWISTKRKTDHPLVDPAHQPTRMPFIEGEPTNFDGPIPGRTDYDTSPASAFCAAAVSRLTASYMTFHYDGGIYGQLPSDQVRTLAASFMRGLDVVPMVDHYAIWRGHHAISPVPRAPFAPNDDPAAIRDHVRRGNLWRVVGNGNVFVGLMEHKDFNMARYAARPIRTVERVVFGDYACGVYSF